MFGPRASKSLKAQERPTKSAARVRSLEQLNVQASQSRADPFLMSFQDGVSLACVPGNCLKTRLRETLVRKCARKRTGLARPL